MTSTTQTAAPLPEEANFRWNFAVNVMDLAFFMLAMNMVSQSTILPLLVTELTPSKLAVGMISAIYSLGFYLPQLFTARHVERLRRKLPFLVWFSGAFERLPYLLIGLLVWFFADSQPGLTLVGFFILIAVTASAGGILVPAWYDMIAKVIPTRRRGVYSGISNGLGAFMGIAGAAVAARIMAELAVPRSYAVCFFAAYAAMLLSWLGLSLNREPDSTSVREPITFWDYAKQLPALLRRDKNYQAFLITRTIASLGWMASGFFIVYGAERFGINTSQAAGLTGMLVGSQALMNLAWGVIADRRGHKLTLVCGAVCIGLAGAAALAATSAGWLWVIFFLLGAAMAADSVSGLNIILEFASPTERPTYIGLTNTLLAPAKVLAPLIGGWLATLLGYPGLFAWAIGLAWLGAAMMALWLKDPRHQQAA